MRSLISIATAILGFTSTLVAAGVPHSRRSGGGGGGFSPFPLKDGFPNPNPVQVRQIQNQSLGTLPNTAPPKNISQEGLNNLRVIAANELFEVAFFNQLLSNVTNNVTGYTVPDKEGRELLIKTLTAVQAQEELHALNANGALKNFKAEPLEPCKYKFPVTDLPSAIALASTFTSVVLGTLQDVIQTFAQNGDAPLTRGIAAVLGQEGEQQGWYRSIQGKIAPELPFLTTSTRDIAFNALNQTFIVPGSCPSLDSIQAKTFQPLTLLTAPAAKTQTQTVRFSFQKMGDDSPTEAGKKDLDLKLVYINQQNKPIVEDFKVVKTEGQTVTIEAVFPYDENLMNGLTIAVLASGGGCFSNVQGVSDATKYGPALIIIN
ncbi:hypothetical protein VTN00DRAFT_6913 [Thermoascus crustaceus]|uniref:uncharacterized protein n=1 Tax=Thermoascus crustaceus TaxID=5088 RepID=UPI003743ADFE